MGLLPGGAHGVSERGCAEELPCGPGEVLRQREIGTVEPELAVEFSQQDFGFVGEGMCAVDVAGVEGVFGLLEELANMVGGFLLGVAELACDAVETLFRCSDGVGGFRACIAGGA